MRKTAKQTRHRSPAAPKRPAYDFVFPGTGIRVPIPAGASEDEATEHIVNHPDVIAMGRRARAERTERERLAAAAATNGKAPVDEAAATAAVEGATP